MDCHDRIEGREGSSRRLAVSQASLGILPARWAGRNLDGGPLYSAHALRKPLELPPRGARPSFSFIVSNITFEYSDSHVRGRYFALSKAGQRVLRTGRTGKEPAR